MEGWGTLATRSEKRMLLSWARRSARMWKHWRKPQATYSYQVFLVTTYCTIPGRYRMWNEVMARRGSHVTIMLCATSFGQDSYSTALDSSYSTRTCHTGTMKHGTPTHMQGLQSRC